MPRVYRDYTIRRVAPNTVVTEIFDCVSGRTFDYRAFSGPFHTVRATFWCRWNTRKAVMRKAWGK